MLSVAAAAPALAVSLPPGLHGYVYVLKDCSPDGVHMTFTIDGNRDGSRYPTPPGYGLYVENVYVDTVVSNAYITFYFPSVLDPIPWTQTGPYDGWSMITVDPSAPAKAGYTGYTTTYADANGWTFHAAAGGNPAYSIASGVPMFSFTTTNVNYCGNTPLIVWALRSVSVNGSPLVFERSATL